MIRKFAKWLFRLYCHEDYYDDIDGDLEELYLRNEEEGTSLKQWRYLIQVIMLFRPALVKDFGQHLLLINTGMFKNYFKISVRNLLRQKVYTAINVFGLAIGLAIFLLINAYVRYERSYDTFHKDYQSIYRLTTDQIVDGQLGTRDAMSFHPSGKALTEEVPEIENYTVTYNFSTTTFKKGEELVLEDGVIGGDEFFIDFFGYQVLAGDASDLKQPNALVLTQDKAEFYFGQSDPIGQTLHLHSWLNKDMKVVAVIENQPKNTHFNFEILMSMATIQGRLDEEGWDYFNYYTYLKINPTFDIAALEEQLVPLAKKYIGEKTSVFFNLQPITEIHLYSDQTYEPQVHGSAKSIDFLEIISFFILVIAWINYINLSTAKAVDRAKEVGLRKVIGARKGQLRIQFLFEALLINFLGALIALLFAQVLAPFFNSLVDESILVDLWSDRSFLSRLLLFFGIGTLVSGLYPAIFLSNFNISVVLKGKFRNSKSGIILRKGLVVSQFAASFALIAGTFTVVRQVDFMQSYDTGMVTEAVIGFANPDASRGEDRFERVNTFNDKLKSHSAIESVSFSGIVPGGKSNDISSTTGGVKIVGVTDRLDATTYIHSVDDAYFDLLSIDFVVGRGFVKGRATDSASVVVNEAFIHRFGIAVDERIINQQLQFGRGDDGDKYKIVGVIRNASRGSVKKDIEPTCYFYEKRSSKTLVRLNPRSAKEGLDFLEATWSEMFPTAPVKYQFLDDRIARLYEGERKFGSVFSAFSVFALLIAALGLFGLSSFMALQRTKEVGIRKVLGGSVSHIVGLFYREFTVLVGVASLVGLPLVYFGMQSWLENYANRIEFPWLVMCGSFLIVLISALLTVGYQVWKVASLNPSKTLKYE